MSRVSGGIQIEGVIAPLAWQLSSFDDEFAGVSESGENAAVEPADARAENFRPVEIAGLSWPRLRCCIVKHHRRADALARSE